MLFNEVSTSRPLSIYLQEFKPGKHLKDNIRRPIRRQRLCGCVGLHCKLWSQTSGLRSHVGKTVTLLFTIYTSITLTRFFIKRGWFLELQHYHTKNFIREASDESFEWLFIFPVDYRSDNFWKRFYHKCVKRNRYLLHMNESDTITDTL